MPLFRRAIIKAEKALGPDHPEFAVSLDNLVQLYCSQGKYDEAEPLYRRALEKNEKTLGPNHPNTVIYRKNLKGCKEAMLRSKNETLKCPW